MNKMILMHSMVIMMAAMLCVCFSSCGSDDKEDGLNPQPEEKSISLVGVWEAGNYFVSLSEDHFLTAYFADRYLDCGYYTINNMVLTCYNSYYAKDTRYSIKLLTDTKAQVTIDYTDLNGEQQRTILTFTKTNKTPITKDNPVVGKSFRIRWSAASTYITTSFNTYNTGLRTVDSGSAKNYPLAMYYIYYNNRVYFQTFKTTTQMPSIGGWNPTENITVWQIKFAPDGTIDDYEIVTSEAL